MKLVTLASDGFTNFVILPDGQNLNLGPVSPLTFVTKLVIGNKRKILDRFLAGENTLVALDLDAMYKLLAPVKKRWATAKIPLIQLQRYQDFDLKSSLHEVIKVMANDKVMQDAIAQMIGEIEKQVSIISQQAKDTSGAPAAAMKTDIEHLHDLVKELRKVPAGQSDNRAFYASDEAFDVNAKIA